jgi:uncharacterized membrane protein YebE (DUF533 family)
MNPNEPNPGRDTLLALIAVAWSDGRIDPAESHGIRRAASDLSLPAGDLHVIEQAMASPITLADVETVRMDRLTRLFTYAAATGIAEIDGALTSEEQETLQLLGDRLGLSGSARNRAARTMRDVVSAAPGGRLGYDLKQLKLKIGKGLSQISND